MKEKARKFIYPILSILFSQMMPDDDKIQIDGTTIASKMALYLGSRREQRIFIEALREGENTNNSNYLSKVVLPLEKPRTS